MRDLPVPYAVASYGADLDTVPVSLADALDAACCNVFVLRWA